MNQGSAAVGRALCWGHCSAEVPPLRDSGVCRTQVVAPGAQRVTRVWCAGPASLACSGAR